MMICLATSLKLQASIDYGLFFKSHSVPGEERTSLLLDNDHPFAIKKDFKIDFLMMVRNEPDFGVILHLSTNEKQLFHFVLAAGENNKNFPALVYNEGMFAANAPIERNKWIPVSLDFHIDTNKIDLKYGEKDTTMVIPLRGTENMKVSFGKFSGYSADVAPINVKDIKITLDGTLVRHWKLGRHNGDTCLDELQKAVASAANPTWIIDSHIEWKKIYSEKSSERLDVAFNTRNAEFYIVRQDKVGILDGTSGKMNTFPVTGGFPAMEFPGHLVFDTLTNKLFSYSQYDQVSSSLSASSGCWSLNERHPEESRHYNHARIFNPADSSFYFFGGYGFYQYRNDLYRLNVTTGKVSEVKYTPVIDSRYSSALAVVGDELYIFGGRGNKQGRQEFNSYFYYDLRAINLKTGKSRKLWENGNSKDIMILASSMYFEPSDSSFYAVSMKKGGVLWKVSMNDSIWTEISKPIGNNMEYQDYEFSFYAAPEHNKLYLVIDKILSDRIHDLNIYSLNTPLLNTGEILQEVEAKADVSSYWIIVVAALLVGGGVFFYRKSSLHKKESKSIQQEVTAEKELVQEQYATNEKKEKEEDEAAIPPAETFFDRSRSAVSLLGTFNVRDKEGNDITHIFTPRLKSLFILLILYTEKSPQGILTKKATDILWADREEDAARNNRNVTLRKLRVVLEKVGDIEIVNDNGFMRIHWGENVFCDYRTALECIHKLKENGEQNDTRLLNQILEVLLYGPLLSNTILEWLDDFKDAYSSMSIDLLRNLLSVHRENQEMVLRITDIMFRHDPLSEEALAAKCSVLYMQGKKGLAQRVYDRFCKEYRDLLGEECKIPLSDLYQ